MSLFQPFQLILLGFLVLCAATSNAQTSAPMAYPFMEKATAECAYIKKKAFERHDIRVGLLKAEGKSDEIPAVEKRRDERIEQLCALVFQTAADKQATAADKQATAAILQGVALKEERAAAIIEGARVKEERAAADRQAAATYREMADVLQKLEKNPSSRADLDRLPIVYARLVAQATEGEKKNALPVIANVMRKLGVKVPGD